MERLSALRRRAREGVKSAMRTARALTDMAAQVLEWERSRRALVAAEHPSAGISELPTESARGRASALPEASVAARASEARRGPVPEPARFQDTIAASHAPRVASLDPEDTLVSLAPSPLESAEREGAERTTH